MKNVLIINGHQKYDEVAEGNLTRAYITKADDFLSQNNFTVKHSTVESDYSVEEEVEKYDLITIVAVLMFFFDVATNASTFVINSCIISKEISLEFF